MPRIAKLLRSHGLGQSTLELALAVPILLTLLAGMFDFGRAVASYALVCNAAREGARAAIFEHTGDTAILAAANSQTLFLGPLPNANVTITPASAADRLSNATVQVSVVYDFQPLLSTLSGLPASFRMTAVSRMLVE